MSSLKLKRYTYLKKTISLLQKKINMKKKILSISAIFATGILMSLILNYKVKKSF